MNTPSPDALVRPHVVVINSEPEFLMVVRELLETEGYDVSTMHVDESPFETIIAVDPAVIVLDFAYEKPDAWNLLATLDEDARTQSIPLVMTSTDELILDQIKNLSTHRLHTALLAKPLELDALVEAVNRFIEWQATST